MGQNQNPTPTEVTKPMTFYCWGGSKYWNGASEVVLLDGGDKGMVTLTGPKSTNIHDLYCECVKVTVEKITEQELKQAEDAGLRKEGATGELPTMLQKEVKALDTFFFTDRQQKLLRDLLRNYVSHQTDFDSETGFKAIEHPLHPYAGWTKTDLEHALRLLRKLVDAMRKRKKKPSAELPKQQTPN